MWKIDSDGWVAVDMVSDIDGDTLVRKEYFAIRKTYTVMKCCFGAREPVEKIATFDTIDEATDCLRKCVAEKEDHYERLD